MNESELKKLTKAELITLLNELKSKSRKETYSIKTIVLNNSLQHKRDVSLNIRDVDFKTIDELFERLGVQKVFRYNLTAAFLAAVRTILDADTNTFNVFVSEFKNTNKVFLNRIHKNRRQHEELLRQQQLIEQ